MSITSPDGRADWLLHIGRLKAVGSVPPGKIPNSVIWGGKYEARIPALSQ